MKQPHPLNVNAIVAALREHGSVQWSLDAIPAEFADWRRRIRQAAHSAGLRISVRRLHGLVLVQHVDHVLTEDQVTAFGKVVAGRAGLGPRNTWEQALHEARRGRLTFLRGDDLPPGAASVSTP